MNQTSEHMNITIQFVTEFSREDTDALWELGVNMDDWDYAIICPPEVVQEEEYEDTETNWVWNDHVPEDQRVWPRIKDRHAYYYGDTPYDKGGYITTNVMRKRWICPEYALDRMLTGCCSNKWYLIEWKGEKKAIGIAYHA